MKQNTIPRFLHLGCGRIYKKGFYNVDVDAQVKADKHFDFNKFPWPLPKNHFSFVEMHHVLEHLDNPTQVIEEIWKACSPGAEVVISVPHWSHFMSWGDLTHKRVYSSAAFLYYEIGYPEYYSKIANYKVVKKEFTMTRTNMLWLNPMFNWLLNASPLFTELILCKILPVSQIIFTLKVIK
jgi:2-polyprenyl-3-methyl-5-hydroxy-6-metoxy-1,4-benzoquinol methylase